MVLVIGGMNQGKYAFAKSLTEDVVRDFHLQIRACMENGEDPWELLGRVVSEHPNGAVTMAELGCGLIPADAFEREYREISGRISCEFAARAEAVYRVCCGIAVRIK